MPVEMGTASSVKVGKNIGRNRKFEMCIKSFEEMVIGWNNISGSTVIRFGYLKKYGRIFT